LHISTAELGRPERLQIDGTAGRLCLQNGEIELSLSDEDMRDYVVTSQALYEGPSLQLVPVELPASRGDHVAIYRNLHRTILGHEQLLIDGREARMSLELANAMILSSHRHREVELPLDPDEYHALLISLQHDVSSHAPTLHF